MYFVNNPVMQRELIVNLRTNRAFVLMLVYQVALAAVVLISYPQDARMDLSRDSAEARRLIDFFFVGQFILASLMAPSFAAGAITGEKERKTYEMLLASPLRPGAIVLGKMVASLTHLAVLIAASLPIIMLCLPLGGVSIYEVLAAYEGLGVSVLLFGSIGIACSSYFRRTSSSLVVSYLIILPLVLIGCLLWIGLANQGSVRLALTAIWLPIIGIGVSIALAMATAHRLLHPPDVGSEGQDVIDLDKESTQAVGLIIQRDQFPDRLFAPPRRTKLMADGANPVYDKEIHAELFSQGTLMLRLVIQISMILAIPLMAWLLFIKSELTGWYMVYVAVFNILVAPVFLAGSVTSERERQTLDLLLTTTLSPWQILWGKLLAGYRVSAVLTCFLLWPVVLAVVLQTIGDPEYRFKLPSIAMMIAVVAMSSLFNSATAMLASTLFRKTSVSLIMSYVFLLSVYVLPLAIWYLARDAVSGNAGPNWLQWLGVASPIMAALSTPMRSDLGTGGVNAQLHNWPLVFSYFIASGIGMAIMIGITLRLFASRWRLTGRG